MKKPKVSLSEVSQTIDLSEFLDATYTEAEKLEIGQALIDRMVERVSEGKGLRFDSRSNAEEIKLKSPYSKTYAESLDFKAAGKSKNKVNMALTGDMLADITVENLPGAKIKLTFNDETETAKAYNHMVGDTVPQRPFFGVTKDDVEDAISNISPATEGPRTIRLLDLLSALDSDGDS